MDLTTLSPVEVLALTIYGESRGEPIQGQVAVGNVIKNRTGGGRSIVQVCLAPDQFSCWDKSDPNYKILIDYAGRLVNDELLQDRYFDQCYFVAEGIIDGKLLDNTQGAKNYVTTDLQKSGKGPVWADKFTLVIGSQVFGTA